MNAPKYAIGDRVQIRSTYGDPSLTGVTGHVEDALWAPRNQSWAYTVTFDSPVESEMAWPEDRWAGSAIVAEQNLEAAA